MVLNPRRCQIYSNDIILRIGSYMYNIRLCLQFSALSTNKLAHQKSLENFRKWKKKKLKDQAAFEPMTTSLSTPALVHSANPAQRCWLLFFANLIHIIHMSPDPAFVTLAHAYNYLAYAVYSVTHPTFYLYEKLAG